MLKDHISNEIVFSSNCLKDEIKENENKMSKNDYLSLLNIEFYFIETLYIKNWRKSIFKIILSNYKYSVKTKCRLLYQ